MFSCICWPFACRRGEAPARGPCPLCNGIVWGVLWSRCTACRAVWALAPRWPSCSLGVSPPSAASAGIFSHSVASRRPAPWGAFRRPAHLGLTLLYFPGLRGHRAKVPREASVRKASTCVCSLVVYGFRARVWAPEPLRVDSCARGRRAGPSPASACGSPVLPAPGVASPFCGSGSSLENRLRARVWVYVWAFGSVPRACVSAFVP